MVYSVLSKNVASYNDVLKKLKNTIKIGWIWLEYRSLTIVILEAMFLDKTDYTTWFLMPWGLQKCTVCWGWKCWRWKSPWAHFVLNTRSMSYKKQLIRNTSWRSWENKKQPLAILRRLRNRALVQIFEIRNILFSISLN